MIVFLELETTATTSKYFLYLSCYINFLESI
jgi:hypothetical protein